MNPQPLPPSKARLITGWIVGGLPAAFLILDAAMKIAKPDFVVEATTKLGFPESRIVPLGAVLLFSTLLYILPRTAVLGAILLTGYLGGAVEVHVHHGDGPFEIFFPVVFGILLWLGLWIRDDRVRALAPIRK